MLRATADIKLPTAIVGSLPRPSWYTENLGSRSFLAAMVNARYREQYVDALGVYLLEQQLAGLDILTDGDCRIRHRRWRPELDDLSAVPHAGIRPPQSPSGPVESGQEPGLVSGGTHSS